MLDTQTSVPPFDQQAPADLQTAQFALGCFWGPDAKFGVLDGVWRTRVGYAGGTKKNPTYHSLGNHIETIQVDFDPETISYEELLRVFWESHHPGKRSRKRQYMSALFPQNGEQERLAQQSKNDLADELGRTVYTELISDPTFHWAEDYHQKYRLRQSRFLNEIAQHYDDPKTFANAPTAARLNGYVAGHGTPAQLEREIDGYGLSEQAQQRLRQLVS